MNGIWMKRTRIASLLGLAALAMACDTSPTDEPHGPAVLSVHLTDAPGDVARVWVDLSEMYFQGSPQGRTVIQSEPTGLVELTSLVGTTQELAAGLELTPGRYRELRMILRSGVLETTEGGVFTFGDAEHPDGLATTGELRCPSCSSSGLKAKLAGDEVTLEAGNQTLLLDFDVSQSFGHAAGGSGAWVMHPVVNGTMQPGPATGVSVSGTVILGTDTEGASVVIPACPADQPRSIADFVPTATATTLVDGEDTPIMKSGATNAEGAFVISALEPDTWAMGYHSEVVFGDKKLVFDATADPMNVPVAADVSGVTYTITGATCNDATSGQSANPTTATVFLTDAPGNVGALWVDVEEIYAQGGPAGRAILTSEPTGLIEVSALVETVQQISPRSAVAAGRYTQLRMVLRGGVLETAEGGVFVYGDATHPTGKAVTGPLRCPSCSDSGLKIRTAKGGLRLVAGENNALVFDMDVKQSLQSVGGSWRLAPVVYAVRTTLGDGQEEPKPTASAGVVAGHVLSDVQIPSCPEGQPRSAADFVPWVVARTAVDSDGEPVKRTASVDALTGSFVIDFLANDVYSPDYASEVLFDGWKLEFEAEARPRTVRVKTGAVAEDVAYRITAATCSRRSDSG